MLNEIQFKCFNRLYVCSISELNEENLTDSMVSTNYETPNEMVKVLFKVETGMTRCASMMSNEALTMSSEASTMIKGPNSPESTKSMEIGIFQKSNFFSYTKTNDFFLYKSNHFFIQIK